MCVSVCLRVCSCVYFLVCCECVVSICVRCVLVVVYDSKGLEVLVCIIYSSTMTVTVTSRPSLCNTITVTFYRIWKA
jgi:hypothetical protein